ncbi:F-box domain-containing protein [Pandoravirus kuranda]|uniref:F-box domain-containing protein n=1 Tax=Pandoravirus kuranda TaxID=3019033 RepID=A0AA95EIV0_9VIRU|nr:F-box domain-containing protein [Pandoravirus kuranda]
MQDGSEGASEDHDGRAGQSEAQDRAECDDHLPRPRKRLCVNGASGVVTSAATTWADLPDEMIYAIARRCSIGSIARLGLVERRAYEVSICQRLWKRFYRNADGAHKVCPMGAACAHGRRPRTAFDGLARHCGPSFDSVSQYVRRWLDNDGLDWIDDRVRGQSAARPSPWQWTLPWHDPLSGCVCHVPCVADGALCAGQKGGDHKDEGVDRDGDEDCTEDDDDDDAEEAGKAHKVDYRWLYATSLQRPVAYRRMTKVGMKTKWVGRTHPFLSRWQGLSAPDWPLSASFWSRDIVATYSGETDDDGRPDGCGTLTAAAVLSSKRVLFRISGTWRRGQPHGTVRAYNYIAEWAMAYFEGQCRRGKPQGRGLAVYRQQSVFDGVWHDGSPSGAGLFCLADRLERYGAYRRSLHTVMWQVVLRPDGTVACETEFIDPFDEDMQNLVHGSASDTDDSDIDWGKGDADVDEGVKNTKGDARNDAAKEGDDEAAVEIRVLLDRFAQQANRPRPRLRAHPMARVDHAGIRDRSGRVIYSGPVTDAYVPKPNRGTLHLRDGTMVTHVGRIKSASQRLVTVTYPRGDRVACLYGRRGPGDKWPRIIDFTYSRDAPKGLAGRTLKGPWRVSPMPSLRVADDVLASNPSARTDPKDDDDEKHDEADTLSVHACPKDIVITHLAHDPPYDSALDSMAALADFVFWLTEHGQEREAFFDHMVGRYGRRWALCRSMADVVS